jgi:hypothetical protein
MVRLQHVSTMSTRGQQKCIDGVGRAFGQWTMDCDQELYNTDREDAYTAKWLSAMQPASRLLAVPVEMRRTPIHVG